jgi:hypothetical protein
MVEFVTSWEFKPLNVAAVALNDGLRRYEEGPGKLQIEE